MRDHDNPKMNECGEFFADFIDHVADSLEDAGLTEEKAGDVAVDTAVRLSKVFAGQMLYVTKRPQVFQRQLCMYNDLKRMKHTDVDKKYGVCVGYSLKVAKQINDARKRRQALKNGEI